MPPTSKPGPTCLYHGSDIPDADTITQACSPLPGPVPIPYPNMGTADPLEEEPADLFDHAKPILKLHIAETHEEEEEVINAVIEACEHNWVRNKNDCNHFLKAVEKELGYSDFGVNDNANAIVEIMEKSSKFVRIKNAAEATQLADEGKLVIAGLRGSDQQKKTEHGHVAIVTAGPLKDGAPTGYWGSLGGTPKKNSSLRWAWTAADIKNVEFFLRK